MKNWEQRDPSHRQKPQAAMLVTPTNPRDHWCCDRNRSVEQ